MNSDEPRCPFCDVVVMAIPPRLIPQLTTRPAPAPPIRVVNQCPQCKLLFAEGEIKRWKEAMEAE